MTSRLFGLNLLAAAVFALAGGLATGQEKEKGKGGTEGKKVDDATFVKMAASGGMHEVKLGEHAQAKGESQMVRDFGKRMVLDHMKANNELREAAKAAGIDVPKEMTEKHKMMVDKLSKLSGAEFDKEYTHHAVDSHKESAALFKGASQSVKNEQLKAFATKTLPVIQEHLKMAQKLDMAGPKGKAKSTEPKPE